MLRRKKKTAKEPVDQPAPGRPSVWMDVSAGTDSDKNSRGPLRPAVFAIFLAAACLLGTGGWYVYDQFGPTLQKKASSWFSEEGSSSLPRIAPARGARETRDISGVTEQENTTTPATPEAAVEMFLQNKWAALTKEQAPEEQLDPVIADLVYDSSGQLLYHNLVQRSGNRRFDGQVEDMILNVQTIPFSLTDSLRLQVVFAHPEQQPTATSRSADHHRTNDLQDPDKQARREGYWEELY